MIRNSLGGRENLVSLGEVLDDGNKPGKEDGDRAVTMYVCGPTVYDEAHVGHARTYVQFDAIRRILRDVMGYNVAYFMNITDVDDKIVTRAREQGMHFKDLANRYESNFWRDMDALGVERPIFTPRATEYIQAIIDHIVELEKQGFAYRGGVTGSVYFDIDAMELKGGKPYRKLDPNRTDDDDDDDTKDLGEKKRRSDFALWKCVEDDNVASWDSPWGKGRPGWHAECAAMISKTAGTFRKDGCLDIHGGGIDLRFPHHENERAQGEVLWCCDEDDSRVWSSVFLHSGHLYIQGRKMSKSLKNFITVKEALDGTVDGLPKVNGRQLRLLFLSHHYSSAMEFTPEVLDEAIAMDNQFANFMDNTVASLNAQSVGLWTERDTEFVNEVIVGCREKIEDAFYDDFDTRTVLFSLRDVVKQTNVYGSKLGRCQPGPIREARQLVERTCHGLGISYADRSMLASSGNIEDAIRLIVDLRAELRQAANSENIKAQVFRICDEIRDKHLRKLGIRLQDEKTKDGEMKTVIRRT